MRASWALRRKKKVPDHESGGLKFRQSLDYFHRFQAQRDYLANQAYDVSWIIKLMGVVDDAAALVGAYAIAVNEPVQG